VHARRCRLSLILLCLAPSAIVALMLMSSAAFGATDTISEPNDDIAHAPIISTADPITGDLSSDLDQDFLALGVRPGGMLAATATWTAACQGDALNHVAPASVVLARWDVSDKTHIHENGGLELPGSESPPGGGMSSFSVPLTTQIRRYYLVVQGPAGCQYSLQLSPASTINPGAIPHYALLAAPVATRRYAIAHPLKGDAAYLGAARDEATEWLHVDIKARRRFSLDVSLPGSCQQRGLPDLGQFPRKVMRARIDLGRGLRTAGYFLVASPAEDTFGLRNNGMPFDYQDARKVNTYPATRRARRIDIAVTGNTDCAFMLTVTPASAVLATGR
jgi:hypothetical protein